MFSRRLLRPLAAAAVVAAIGAGGLGAAAPAAAAPAPIKDPQSSGYLGFCDQSGHQVRSGNLAAAPFAWKIVSSTAAPDRFAKGVATVLAYQPRPEIDPGEWSGKQLTDSSTFSNAKHPMVEGTRIDAALEDVVFSFPPKVKGLYQLRMHLGAPNTPAASSYPAVFVRVQGDRWTQVDGGKVDCGAGKAVSAEHGVYTPQQLNPQQSRPGPDTARQAAVAERAATSAPRSAGTGSSAANRTDASTGSPDSSVAASPAAAERNSGSGFGGTPLWIFVAIVVALLAAAGAFIAGHRRETREEG